MARTVTKAGRIHPSTTGAEAMKVFLFGAPSWPTSANRSPGRRLLGANSSPDRTLRSQASTCRRCRRLRPALTMSCPRAPPGANSCPALTSLRAGKGRCPWLRRSPPERLRLLSEPPPPRRCLTRAGSPSCPRAERCPPQTQLRTTLPLKDAPLPVSSPRRSSPRLAAARSTSHRRTPLPALPAQRPSLQCPRLAGFAAQPKAPRGSVSSPVRPSKQPPCR